MTKSELKQFLPKWRVGSLSLLEFHSLKRDEKNNYIKSLMLIPDNEKGDVDIHILRFYSIDIKPNTKNFYTLDEL
jgi:hypothetical protein